MKSSKRLATNILPRWGFSLTVGIDAVHTIKPKGNYSAYVALNLRKLRHCGRDCRNPVAKDGILLSHIPVTGFQHPCWNDGSLLYGVSSYTKRYVQRIYWFSSNY
jgi:hypothetical protein